MTTLWSYLFRPEQGMEQEIKKFPSRAEWTDSSLQSLGEQDWVVIKDEDKELQEGTLQFLPTVPRIPVESFTTPISRFYPTSELSSLPQNDPKTPHFEPMIDEEPAPTIEILNNQNVEVPIEPEIKSIEEESQKEAVEMKCTKPTTHVAMLLLERDSLASLPTQTEEIRAKKKGKSKNRKKSHSKKQ